MTPKEILHHFEKQSAQWQRYCLATLGLTYMRAQESGLEVIAIDAETRQPALAMVLATGDSATEILKVHERSEARKAGGI